MSKTPVPSQPLAASSRWDRSPYGPEPTSTSVMPGAATCDLVRDAQRGNQSAFSELMRRFHGHIYSVALHWCGNVQDAEDVTQDTFLRAYAKLDAFHGASEFYTWLYRIAVNLSLNLRRQRERRATVAVTLDEPPPRGEQDDVSADARCTVELRDVYRHLVAALDALPEPLRLTMLLVALQGMSHERASEVLGCSSGTIGWRIHTARRRLADELKASPRLGARSRTIDADLLSRWVPALSG